MVSNDKEQTTNSDFSLRYAATLPNHEVILGRRGSSACSWGDPSAVTCILGTRVVAYPFHEEATHAHIDTYTRSRSPFQASASPWLFSPSLSLLLLYTIGPYRSIPYVYTSSSYQGDVR